MWGLPSLARYRPGYRIAVFLIALAAGAIASTTQVAAPLDDQLRIVRDNIRTHEASGDIVLVEIDARSLAEIDRWPWPRSNHATLVRRLEAAGADMVAFDVDFSSASDPAEDQAFAAALTESHSLILLPAFRQFAGSGSRQVIESEPIAPLREASFLAAVNIQPDASGQVRRALLGVYTDGVPRPSLPAMLSGVTGSADTSFPIDYSIDPGSIPRLSYADVVAGRADLTMVEGKSVMVGATAIELGDRYAVPGHGVIPGVVIQALAAETLLAQGIPREFGPLAGLGIAFLSVLLLISRGTLWVRCVSAAIGGLFVLGLPLVAESRFNASYEIAPALAMLAAAGSAGLCAMVLRKYLRTALLERESGLHNRAALLRAMGRKPDTQLVIARIAEYPDIATVISAGDIKTYFREIARRLGVATHSTLYRIDDNLLAWLCDGFGNEELGDHLDAIDALFKAPISVEGQRVDTNLFFGVAEGKGADAHHLISGASLAATRATEAGYRWERYFEGDEDGGKWRIALLGELDEALRSGALWVAFQPQLDIVSGGILGAEALIRWNHPVRGPIPPDSFIPLVEKRGRIADLSLFTVDRALEALRKWQGVGLDMSVAVNISATLLKKRDFLDAMWEKIESSGVRLDALTIEITESAALEDPEAAIAAMNELRERGIRLSVDDYGTGQSTLTYLRKLPVHEIKIDKSFVQGLTENASDRILIRSTIELAHELGLKVVAEGIENLECLEALKELDCDIAQGFFIGRPMEATAFEMLAENGGANRASAIAA
ncbi:putative bifunctional diguanylate cyclase/phosphodiesterase [Parasphingopyxis marina]|uniref:EAL domain-containing protein n=1 Tax=Parasphingopyxis marina TaxID=2761622 RepID=A0A842HZN4_9SPHN|nr:EAL domain-containing protein [Parasphingopyxis marina]MBC2777839.1 EAL domain-containing protein [Parasphingopyxis marina]